MHNEFEGLGLSAYVGLRVFQDGEKVFRLGDHAITVTALAGHGNIQVRLVTAGPNRPRKNPLALSF
jgi:hypothetical protein